MKVLHVGKFFYPHKGGLEFYMRDTLVEFSRRGIECAAMVHQHEAGAGDSDEVFETGGVNIRVVRAAVQFNLLFTPFSRSFRRLLEHLLGEFRPDVLHLHLPNPSVFWVLASTRAKKIPWVVQWHSDVVAATWPMRMAYAAYRLFEKRLLQRAAAVVVSSQTYLEASEPLARFREKCHVVPLGIDVSRYEQQADTSPSGLKALLQEKPEACSPADESNAAAIPVGAASAATGGPELQKPQSGPKILSQITSSRDDLVGGPSGPTDGSLSPATPQSLRVLAVGRLTYYKGFRYLLEALAHVPNIHLTLVGTGDEEKSLRALADSLGLNDRVTFTGALDDAGLVRAFRDCDCLCLPSIERTEAFGVVLLEAMYFGKPILSSRLEGSGMNWLVEDGVNGLKFEPANVDSLAAALRAMAADADARNRMGAAGRVKLEADFSIGRSADGLQAVYSNLPGPLK